MSVCRLWSFLFNAKLLEKIYIHLSITIKRLVKNPKPVMLYTSKLFWNARNSVWNNYIICNGNFLANPGIVYVVKNLFKRN